MSFLAVCCFLSKASSSSAYPLILHTRNSSNNTSNPAQSTSGWVGTPNVRGTADLLISSLTTLALCAWTAYHPNVNPKRSLLHTSLRRFKWMLAAILIPEWVLYCAWNQRYSALALKDTINKILEKDIQFDTKYETINAAESQATTDGSVTDGQSSKPPATTKRSMWTTEQAFFATSGGFSVDASTFWPQEQLTFTPNGLVELARLGLLPDVSPTTITDKTKADVVAKVLVCLQAGWFLVQTIARLIQHLPVTLLEVHVVAHIGCAFGMYLLWLEKPYDAEYPIAFEDERVRDLAALFAVDGESDKRHRYRPHADPGKDENEVDIRDVRSAHAYANKGRSKRARLHHSLHRSEGSSTGPKHRLTNFSDDDWFKATFPQISTKEAEDRIQEHVDRANRGVRLVWTPAIQEAVQPPHLPTSEPLSPISTSSTPLPNPSNTPSPSSSSSPHPSPSPSAHSLAPPSPPSPSPAPSSPPLPSPASPSSPPLPSLTPTPPASPSLTPRPSSRATTSSTSSYATLDPHLLYFSADAFPTRATTSRPSYPSPHVVSTRRNHRIKGQRSLFSGAVAGRDTSTRALTTMTLLGFYYGAVHLSAWNAFFVTETERWMWRVAGVAFAGFPVLLLGAVVVGGWKMGLRAAPPEERVQR
ncbi:hypothetical protein BU16DRAFT_518682, partial [Lophium mytilinum]